MQEQGMAVTEMDGGKVKNRGRRKEMNVLHLGRRDWNDRLLQRSAKPYISILLSFIKRHIKVSLNTFSFFFSNMFFFPFLFNNLTFSQAKTVGSRIVLWLAVL